MDIYSYRPFCPRPLTSTTANLKLRGPGLFRIFSGGGPIDPIGSSYAYTPACVCVCHFNYVNSYWLIIASIVRSVFEVCPRLFDVY